MKNVVVFLADGAEECEALACIDILRRAGIKVTTASIMGRLDIKAAHDVVLMADELAENADYEAADMVILPGGGVGTENLSRSSLVKEQCLDFAASRKVAAICAAPSVLALHGLLEGRRATCYPGMESQMAGAVITGDLVTVDGTIITGKGPGAAVPFALQLVEELLDKETADQVAEGFIFSRV